MPLISVIIPTYNRAHVLPNSIKSVLDQSFEDWELIVVDDGSEDNTKEMVEEFLMDSRVSYYFQKNKGVSEARNHGAKISKGDYLIFLDSDDRLAKESIYHFRKKIKTTSFDVVFSWVKLISEEKKSWEIKKMHKNYPCDKNDMPKGVYLPGAFCIKKELFFSVGSYDPNLHYGENTDLFLRLHIRKYSYGFVEYTSLLHFVGNKSGLSSNLKEILNSNLILLEKHSEYFKKNSITYSSYLQVAGVCFLRFGKYSQASKCFWKAYRLNPRRISSLSRWIVSKSSFLSNFFYPLKSI
ncbi:glycosyltransferase family 2 protein [Belliella sp. DSM 107340]|uniref:Glycosyltransferase family 2 protein n=1 Tax=Belliella calami TaxID=2923436 RepID=A0ABS9UIS0_9BACT|nr:glycosyltransferase family 2 protein [Belliella calami]MCH7396511.1 glycosyltransferase family 2 protein [Belliella calami]